MTKSDKETTKRGATNVDGRAAFIDWYWSRPRVGTQTEFAARLGVDPATLSTWKNTPEFKAKADLYKTLLLPDFIEATSKMLELAKAGNVNAFRAVMEVLGQKAPDKLDLTVDRVAYVQPGTLAALAQKLYPN